MPVSPEEAQLVYRRLLANEPDAPNDAIELFLDPLLRALNARYPGPGHEDLVFDAVSNSLVAFVQDPSRYQPERASLWSFLYMDVQGDILNAMAREKKHWNQTPYDPAEHDLPDRATDVEVEVFEKLAPTGLPDGLTLAEVLARVRETIDDARDRQVLDLMMSGERKSQVFSRALDIEHLPELEQRRIIKQHKDRIDARLRRLGERIRNERSI